MADLTPEQIAELRRLDAEATPRPCIVGPHSDDRHGPEVLCCNGDPACDKPRVPNSLWCADHQPIPLCDRCNHKATSHWTGNDFDDCNELSCACRQFIGPCDPVPQ